MVALSLTLTYGFPQPTNIPERPKMALIDQLSEDLSEGYEWSENDLQLIALAQAQLNDITTLEALLEAEGAITPGSRGQMRLNAIFTEVRGARLAAARIISLLKVDETKPGRGNRSPAARSRI
jgi:hypothetical protein